MNVPKSDMSFTKNAMTKWLGGCWSTSRVPFLKNREFSQDTDFELCWVGEFFPLESPISYFISFFTGQSSMVHNQKSISEDPLPSPGGNDTSKKNQFCCHFQNPSFQLHFCLSLECGLNAQKCIQLIWEFWALLVCGGENDGRTRIQIRTKLLVGYSGYK